MAIDFTFPQEVDDARLLVRKFMQESVRPRMDALREEKRRVMSGEPPFMN